MQVRLAEQHEHAAVGELTVAAFAPFLLGPDDPYADTLRDAATRAASTDLWVAVDGDTLLGTVTDTPAGSAYRELAGADEGEFRMLAVAPEAQGRGVGEALVRHVIERSRAAGHRAVLISTLPHQTGAHRIYERLGFIRRPEHDWRPRPDVLLIAYRLDLGHGAPS